MTVQLTKDVELFPKIKKRKGTIVTTSEEIAAKLIKEGKAEPYPAPKKESSKDEPKTKKGKRQWLN